MSLLVLLTLPPSEAPCQDATDTLIEELGDNDVQVRRAAFQKLIGRGTAIRPHLRKALDHSSLRVRARVRIVLDRIATNYRPVSVLGPHPRPLDVSYATDVAFSPDGKRVAVTGQYERVDVIDVEGREPSLTLKGLVHRPRLVAFSTDGTMVATSGIYGELVLWKLAEPERPVKLQAAGAHIRRLAFTPDGSRVISSGIRGEVRVWSVEKKSALFDFKGHTGDVGALAVSPDGTFALSGGTDETPLVWDIDDGRLIRKLVPWRGWISCAAISPDGKLGAVGGGLGIKVFDLKTGKVVAEPKGHERAVWSVLFSKDGTRLLTAGQDRTWRIWDPKTGRQLRSQLDFHKLSRAIFSPDEKSVLTLGSGNQPLLWDLDRNEVIPQRFVRNLAYITADPWMGISPNTSGLNDTLWSLEDGKPRHRVRLKKTTRVYALSEDGRHALCRTNEDPKMLTLMDVQKNEVAVQWEVGGFLFSADLSRDGKYVIYTDNEAVVTLAEREGKKIREWRLGVGFSSEGIDFGTPRKLLISRDNRRVAMLQRAGNSQYRIRVFSAESGKQVGSIEVKQCVFALAFPPDEKHILVSTRDGRLLMFDFRTGEVDREFVGHSGNIRLLRFSRDGESFLSAGKQLILWRR